MNKFLDYNGLAYFWGKLKSWVTSRGYITSSGSITGNAATATRLAGPKYTYTTAANAAKNWYRIANANTSQIDTTKPLHVQFMLTAYNTSVNNDYYQRWFVDCEVFGRQSGIRLFGNSAIPFSQIRVLYENTDASVTTSNRPAIDIYLNYVIASATSIKIEEINNSGFDFLADGVLTASTVPTGFESRAVGVYGSGVNNCGTADYATYHCLYGYNISANTTLSSSNSNHRYRILNCTGTITLTVPSWNSSSGWFFIKNNGTGVVTVHPASTSVMFDNVSADITLQPGEFIRLACQSNNHYSIVDDGRWMSKKADASHNQASNTINAMTGYSKPSSTSAIATTDSLNTAIGKLEKETEYLGDEILLVDAEAANGVAIASANQLFISDLQEVTDTKASASHTHGNITNDGKVGTASGKPLITGTSGAVQAGSFGTTAGTFCEGNDSRLSNARTPTSHTHGSITNDGKLGTASRVVVTNGNKAIGVSSVTATELGYLSGVTSAVQTQISALETALDNMLKTKIYPVGSTYFSLTDSRNPNTILGFGTWTKIEGKFLLGASSSYAADSTGGEATHTLTVDEMPSHKHGIVINPGTGFSAGITYTSTGGVNNNFVQAAGGGQAHNNLPPYLAGYLWRRTA